MPKFIEYQYGELSESIRPHASVIKILSKYELYKGLINPLDTPKNKNKKQEQLKEIEKELPSLQKKFENRDVKKEFEHWKDYLDSKGKKYVNYKSAFRNWLRNDNFRKNGTEDYSGMFK